VDITISVGLFNAWFMTAVPVAHRETRQQAIGGALSRGACTHR
jgi:hypothetical protein